MPSPAPAFPSTYAARAATLRPSAAPAASAPGAGAAGPYAAQANRYRDAELASATPGQLVVMLFDRLVLTLQRARAAMDAGQIEARTELVLRAADMVGELRLSLDHAQGGDIAGQLDALYGFMLRELFDANRHQDGARLAVVARIAGELREAFAGAQAQLAAAAGTAATAGVASLEARSA
jgi:flagellar protein FliS